MGEAGGPRPDGPLVWLHLGRDAPMALAPPLLRRLREEDEETALLVTSEPEARPEAAPPGVAAALTVPADHPPFARAFLDHWRPDACAWLSGTLRPALMDGAMARMPLVVAGARAEAPAVRALGVPAALMAQVRRVMALDMRDAQAWRRLGAPSDRVEVAGPLQSCAEPPPDDEPTRRTLTARLAGRVVWFAPAVPPALVPAVMTAHGQVLRRAHRALLVLEPAGAVPEDLDPARTVTQTAGSPASCPFEDVHETIVVEGPGLEGLWYRMAPVTLLSDTLRPGLARIDPDAPAALGSALVHGVHHGPHEDGYARLASEGASLELAHEGEAATAVEALLAPDRAARQAHAAWAVVTRGAEATDRLATTLVELMDG